MLKSIEAQGVTRDEAISAALRESGLDRDSVSVEVLDNGKKGFFGIGATPARVRITYEVAEEVPPVKKPQPKVAEKQMEKISKMPVEAENRQSVPAEVEKIEEKTRHRPQYVPGEEMKKELIPDVAQNAVQFIDGLLQKLGIEGHGIVLATTTQDTVQIEIVGPDMGPVIGRRGDTLDAIQYLTSLVANREREEHTRITIDTENYRAKREESLQRLAHKMAGKVLKYHKNMTLEPMNPYERRIIHAALQDVRGVTTYSTGTEPGRRVVIAPEGRASGRSYPPRSHDSRER